jgi:hypothetical protein
MSSYRFMSTITTYIFLAANVLVESFVLYVTVDGALHHRGPVVVFYVAFPTGLNQKTLPTRNVLLEALFPKVLDSVVVGISQEVIYSAIDGMIL